MSLCKGLSNAFGICKKKCGKQNLNKPTQNGSQAPSRNNQSPKPNVSVNGNSIGDSFRSSTKMDAEHTTIQSHYDMTKVSSLSILFMITIHVYVP
ncbi:unnamed protein product [Callosobruchus maculatus]|uniref:Uncharacterized protein n=1 Tax=Callosobruchus maculatus TaxID=64391 RepID=A0A653BNZ4_CALMS|nr:unnamed protein product [Callosobruchus maculatus]